MERHRKRVESHQLNIDEYYSRIPKISGQRYGLRVSPLFPRQVRAFTAILIIEDADQTWRSNFPLKRLGWQRLSRRIDPASRIFDTPQYFVMDIQYLRWWTNELIDWQQKKNRQRDRQRMKFCKYSTGKRAAQNSRPLPRDCSISWPLKGSVSWTGICFRISWYFGARGVCSLSFFFLSLCEYSSQDCWGYGWNGKRCKCEKMEKDSFQWGGM